MSATEAEQQTLRLASLERVTSYPAVSSWWNVVTNYYTSAKNSQNQTLASSVNLVERVTTPALRGLAMVPSYCPEGIVETVDGVADRQLQVAEALVARGTATVVDSTTYVRETKDAAVARGTATVVNSTTYVCETKDAAVARGCDLYANSSSYVLSSKDAVVSQVSGSSASVLSTVVNNGSHYVVSTREYATSSIEGSKKVLEDSIAPATSRVAAWRTALRQQFTSEATVDAPQNQEEGEKMTPFQRVATVFPGIVRFNGDVVARPIIYCVEGVKQRRDFVYQMFQQAQETSQNHIRATRDFIQPAVSQPIKTASSLKESTRSLATRALTTQRNLLETIRDSVTSLEKTRGTQPESQLLRQLDYVPSFVFSWTTKTIDFSDAVLVWTNNYVSLPKEEVVAPVDE